MILKGTSEKTNTHFQAQELRTTSPFSRWILGVGAPAFDDQGGTQLHNGLHILGFWRLRWLQGWGAGGSTVEGTQGSNVLDSDAHGHIAHVPLASYKSNF